MAAAMLAQEGSVYLLDRLTNNVTTYLRLYTAPNPVTETVNFGAMTEATFDGYAGVSFTFPAASINTDGEAETLSPEATFQRTASGAPQTVLGVVLEENDAGAALWSDVFRDPDTDDPEPVVFEVAGDKVRYRSRLTLHRCLTITV